MKKYLSFIAYAMMAVFSLTFVSCGDDDDEPASQTSDFVGTWSLQSAEGWGEFSDDEFEYLQLKSDGTCIDVQEDDEDDKGYTVDYGKWWVSGDRLNLQITSGTLKGSTFTYEIIKRKKNKITVSLFGITAYLIKVNDNTIEKYL